MCCTRVIISSDGWTLIVFFQAEDGIRDLVRSRGLGDVYKRQASTFGHYSNTWYSDQHSGNYIRNRGNALLSYTYSCLLYTSDAADERSSVDLGGRRIIKKKTSSKYDISFPYHNVQSHLLSVLQTTLNTALK